MQKYSSSRSLSHPPFLKSFFSLPQKSPPLSLKRRGSGSNFSQSPLFTFFLNMTYMAIWAPRCTATCRAFVPRPASRLRHAPALGPASHCRSVPQFVSCCRRVFALVPARTNVWGLEKRRRKKKDIFCD